MHLAILGGGLSALSLACFVQHSGQFSRITILEKEDRPGGLCRSFEASGVTYDVGPHIIFSKDREVLDWMNALLAGNLNRLRRSNRILHKGAFVQYPFENDLSKLPEDDRNFCVNAFLHNPYEGYSARNMLQFFLKTFGEGITNTYLRPYNEKIWKFDPAFMDTQMVDRIPKPPKEDILRSAAGETVDGYVHQLYFTYPEQGGTQAIIEAIRQRLTDKVTLLTNSPVTHVTRKNGRFRIEAGGNALAADAVVSTLPAPLLPGIYEPETGETPEEIRQAAASLRSNSIIIAVVNVRPDRAGDNFAFMVADKNVAFHRLSKLDFLGERYHKPGSTSYMAEITYRRNDLIDKTDDAAVLNMVIRGLKSVGFIDSPSDVNFTDIRRFEYAYVIYDLEHRRSMDRMKGWYARQGMTLHGRFGAFEYWNMDAVIRQSMLLAERLNS